MEVTIEELKEIQLNILKTVHLFCEKHGIKYYLTYGTLIGAIRHKGYIPWDDDIDICMPRPDYEKFMKMFNNEEKQYKFVSYELDKKFLYTYGKVIDTHTKLIENVSIKYPLGINIDIFPIDGIDDDIITLKMQVLLRSFINIKTIVYSKNRTLIKNAILLMGKIVLWPVPCEFLIKCMINNSKLHAYQKSEHVCCVAIGTKLNKPVPKDFFAEGHLVPFERQYFNVPTKYDAYLRSIFGDYMKLPPKEQRVTHHVFEAYNVEGEK